MGIHVAGEEPAMDALVADSIREIGSEIDALRIPRLRGVVLGGGYGRGEGGVLAMPDGSRRLHNDLDFYVVVEDGSSAADMASVTGALEPIARRWSEKLSMDVEFSIPKTPWRIRHDQERVMIQELLHGYFDVAGQKGEELFGGVERREPSAFPWTEAVRLLVNRGVGLTLARTSEDETFAERNVNKCVLGAGDAVLIARHEYAWRAVDRAAALGWPEYDAAVEWKFRPRKGGVCGWEDARRLWLKGSEEVRDAGRRTGAYGRSLYQAARWIVRRWTLGDLRTLGQGAVVRIWDKLLRVVEAREPLPEPLRKDWNVFN